MGEGPRFTARAVPRRALLAAGLAGLLSACGPAFDPSFDEAPPAPARAVNAGAAAPRVVVRSSLTTPTAPPTATRPPVSPTPPPATASPTRPPPSATMTARPTTPPPTATLPAPTATRPRATARPTQRPRTVAAQAGTPARPAATRVVVVAATPKPPALDPSLVALALQMSGLPIAAVQVLNSQTDPDQLFGKAGQYSGKIGFQDKRAGNSHGFIELFDDVANLRSREGALAAQAQAAGLPPALVAMASQKALVRAPTGLTAADAAAYAAALGRLGGR